MSFAMNHLNFLDPRSAKVECHYDNHHKQICKKESIFHRIGRWILIAFLVFFGLIALLVICCIIKRRKGKKAKAMNNTEANYTMPQYGTPYGGSGPPPVGMDSKPNGQVNGHTNGAAQGYYNAPTQPQPVH